MYDIGVGFFVGAGVPRGPRVNTFVECGCCGAYHRTDFNGDCREDSERYWDLPDDAEIACADCESTERPCQCCEWCEMFPCECDSDECEFEQRQPHEWYCVVHDVTKIAGTTEPVSCDWQETGD